jgi:hypothetical protein
MSSSNCWFAFAALTVRGGRIAKRSEGDAANGMVENIFSGGWRRTRMEAYVLRRTRIIDKFAGHLLGAPKSSVDDRLANIR